MTEPHLVAAVGELLWDILPDGAHLGGAPANFTVMAGRLGDHAAILSRIGRDDLGRRAIERLGATPIETGFLQIDPAYETGRVTVSLEDREPHYAIHRPAAWDFLELSDEWVQLAGRTNAICFGSLAQRDPQSRETIQALLAATPSACLRIFDVNLRPPFYSADVIRESLKLATIVKMNENEVPLVLELLELNSESFECSQAVTNFKRSAADRLLSLFPALQMVAITLGARGSLLVTRDEWHEHHGFQVKVADGIGAGDAFTAAMAHYMLRGADLATLNEAGNRWGSWMTSQSGAMPALPQSVCDAITAEIEKMAGQRSARGNR